MSNYANLAATMSNPADICDGVVASSIRNENKTEGRGAWPHIFVLKLTTNRGEMANIVIRRGDHIKIYVMTIPYSLERSLTA